MFKNVGLKLATQRNQVDPDLIGPNLTRMYDIRTIKS